MKCEVILLRKEMKGVISKFCLYIWSKLHIYNHKEETFYWKIWKLYLQNTFISINNWTKLFMTFYFFLFSEFIENVCPGCWRNNKKKKKVKKWKNKIKIICVKNDVTKIVKVTKNISSRDFGFGLTLICLSRLLHASHRVRAWTRLKFVPWIGRAAHTTSRTLQQVDKKHRQKTSNFCLWN